MRGRRPSASGDASGRVRRELQVEAEEQRVALRLRTVGAADAERRKKPVPAGLMIHDLGAGRAETAPKPYIRVSPNNRVVVVDGETGRQMHFLGELRRLDGRRCFVLATRENRFFSPVEDGIGAVLADLDGREIAGSSAAERELAAEIAQRLGLD